MTSRGTSVSPKRTVKVENLFQDSRYTLVAFQSGEDDCVLLHDAIQHSLFLGQRTRAIDLSTFWKRHEVDESYCLACELMLCFDDRWIAVTGEPAVELGIGIDTARRLLKVLKGKVPSLDYLEVGSL